MVRAHGNQQDKKIGYSFFLSFVIFRDYIDDFLGIFMDDIIVYSKSVEEHYEHLRKLFTRMREWKLYAHPEKCEFFRSELEYLGIGISAQGIRITDTSREAISKWELPQPNQRNKKNNANLSKDFGSC